MNIKLQILILDKIGLLVLKAVIWKMTPVCEGFF